MNLPNIIHPTTFKIGEIHIRVASYFALTDKQAAGIAMHCYRSRKWKKADAKKVHTQFWIGDRAAAAMYG
ncbi:MAG: hypothetical protein L6Q63_04090 [Giesbergeria sp.]|nr:hypothetical protein [Giesbergeria sp.]